MKKCDYCSKVFTIISNGSGGHNRKYCYDCFPDGLPKSERLKLRRSLLRRKADEQKLSKGCQVCEYNRTPSALEYHHIEDDKLDNPSDLINKSWEIYQEEVDKCILLCSNCHREVHDGILKLPPK